MPASVSFDDLKETVRIVQQLSETVAIHEAALAQLIDRITSLERRLDPAPPSTHG